MDRLRSLCDGNHPQYGMELNRHVSSDSPDDALRHMFFVVINPDTNIGHLVMGDIDHVAFYLKT